MFVPKVGSIAVPESDLWRLFPQILLEHPIAFTTSAPQILVEKYSYKAWSERFPTNLVGLAFNNKSCHLAGVARSKLISDKLDHPVKQK